MMVLMSALVAVSFIVIGIFCAKIFKEEDQLEQQTH